MTIMNKTNNIAGNLDVRSLFVRTSKSRFTSSSGNPCGSYMFQMGSQHLKPPTIATVTKWSEPRMNWVKGVKQDGQFMMLC